MGAGYFRFSDALGNSPKDFIQFVIAWLSVAVDVSKTIDLLQKTDFFQSLHRRILKEIAVVCVPRKYVEGDFVITQGGTGLGLFFILDGKVQVEVEKDGQKLVVAQLGKDAFFGELSIIDNKPRSASVVALEDTDCLLLTRDSFSKLMNKHPVISVELARGLAERLRITTEKLTAQNVSTAPAADDSAKSSSEPPVSEKEQTSTAEASSESQLPWSSSKKNVQDFLVDTFSQFYTMKAMTRFSAAVIGCPVSVEVSNPSLVTRRRFGEVEVLLFPTSEAHDLHFSAYADGSVSATLIRPSERAPGVLINRFQFPVAEKQRFRLRLPSRGAPELLIEPPPGA